VASTVLQGTGLQLTLRDLGVKYAEGPAVKPTHDAAYWAEAAREFDFSPEDRIPPALFNAVLWKGMMATSRVRLRSTRLIPSATMMMMSSDRDHR
jgi:hypothetical protein